MGVTPGRVSQIENGDLDVNEVATLSRYAQALVPGSASSSTTATTCDRSPKTMPGRAP